MAKQDPVLLAQRLFAEAASLGATGEALSLLKTLVADKQAIKAAAKGSGRRRSTPRGSKEKGRQGVEATRQWLLSFLLCLDKGIVPDDLLIQTTSVGGSDIHASPRVTAVWPFAPEIKNVELLNIWQALAQAQINATKKGCRPVLFFRRNNTPLHIAMLADDFARFILQVQQACQSPTPSSR